MNEVYTLKEKLLLTAAGSMMFSVFAIAWGIPGEWLYGWPIWALFGLLAAMTAVLFGAVVGTAFWCGVIREVIRRRREDERRRDEPVKLVGRGGMYVSREVVCRAAEGMK